MAHDDQNSETPNHGNRNSYDRGEVTVLRIRRELALILVGFIVVVALIAVMQSGAMPILDKFLPAIMLVLGFFFGQKTSRL
jgi:hypothetical protein